MDFKHLVGLMLTVVAEVVSRTVIKFEEKEKKENIEGGLKWMSLYIVILISSYNGVAICEELVSLFCAVVSCVYWTVPKENFIQCFQQKNQC